MIFTIEANPIPKMRHRYVLRHGTVISYDPQDDVKKSVRFRLQQKLRKALDSDDKNVVMQASSIVRGTVFDVVLQFFLPIPASTSKKDASRILWLGYATNKPDIDNLAKFYLDAANGILWPDDKQIVSLKILKSYSEKPRTVIQVIGMNPMSLNEKVKGILGVFTPERFQEFVNDITALVQAQAEDQRNPELDRTTRATRSAMLLSKLSDSYGSDLNRIRNKYPGYWEDHNEGTLNMIEKV